MLYRFLVISVRIALCFGSLGYAAYAACGVSHAKSTFCFIGRTWNGLSAAFLWTVERTGIVAYALEEKKGLYVAVFWTVYQTNTVIGAAISAAQNWSTASSDSFIVTDGTYIGLFITLLIGAFTALLLYPMDKMIREDGTRVTLPSQISFKERAVACWQQLSQTPGFRLLLHQHLPKQRI